MTNEDIEKILNARIPGGSFAKDWFLPHEYERGYENVKDVVRRMIAVEHEIIIKKLIGLGALEDGDYIQLIRARSSYIK